MLTHTETATAEAHARIAAAADGLRKQLATYIGAVRRATADPAALPDEARVSKVPTPSICLPSCTEGLTRLREKSRTMLANSALPATLASALPIGSSPPTSRPPIEK